MTHAAVGWGTPLKWEWQWDLRGCDEDQSLCLHSKQLAGGCHLSSVRCYQEPQTSQGCCSFLPGNLRADFKERRSQVPSGRVTARGVRSLLERSRPRRSLSQRVAVPCPGWPLTQVPGTQGAGMRVAPAEGYPWSLIDLLALRPTCPYSLEPTIKVGGGGFVAARSPLSLPLRLRSPRSCPGELC